MLSSAFLLVYLLALLLHELVALLSTMWLQYQLHVADHKYDLKITLPQLSQRLPWTVEVLVALLSVNWFDWRLQCQQTQRLSAEETKRRFVYSVGLITALLAILGPLSPHFIIFVCALVCGLFRTLIRRAPFLIAAYRRFLRQFNEIYFFSFVV